jgi:hypothetical protein
VAVNDAGNALPDAEIHGPSVPTIHPYGELMISLTVLLETSPDRLPEYPPDRGDSTAKANGRASART